MSDVQMSQPSSNESLQALLARVHERLNETGSVDTTSRELLSQVMADIERALEQGGGAKPADAPGEPAATAAKAQTPRLEALAVKFEASHPSLADLLFRLADLLAKGG